MLISNKKHNPIFNLWNGIGLASSQITLDQIQSAHVHSSLIIHCDSWMIEYPRNRDDWEKVSESVSSSPRFLCKCRPLLIEMTPSLITAIHVLRNNYATTRVVTRLAFLSYPACSWPTLVFVDDVARLIGEIITAVQPRSEFRTCQNERASPIGSLPDIIKAIYQLIQRFLDDPLILRLFRARKHSYRLNEPSTTRKFEITNSITIKSINI